tara:strand:+ start:1809 stop:3464 length:1656 start_codon:yes stop_codon:yes gene_type:complete
MKIINMKSAPIVGYQNKEIISLSKKIAKAYNESVDIIDKKLFLGFKFKRINELKDVTASFNFKENILEINITDSTTILVPSRRIDEYTACKLFNFNEIYSLDKKSHVLLESRFNKYNLLETRTGKGQASSWVADKMTAGLASAYAIVGKDIEIENPETIRELAKNINSDIKKHLDMEPGQDKFIDAISGFIVSGDVKKIDSLYDIITKNSLKSKYAKKVSDAINKEFTNEFGEIEKGKKVLDSRIDEIVAEAYGTHASIIKTRLADETFKSFMTRFYTYFANGLGMIFDTVKAVIASFITYKFTFDGVMTTITQAGEYIIQKFCDLLKYLIGPSKSNIKSADLLIASDEWGDQLVGWFNKTIQSGQELAVRVVSVVDSIQSTLLSKFSEYVTQPIDSSPYGKMIAYTVAIIITVYSIIKLKNVILNALGILDQHRTSAEDAFMNFNINHITSKAGFDRIFVIESIMTIISMHIKNAIQKEKLNKLEKERLKKLNHLLVNTSKKKTKKGIKIFVDNIEEYIQAAEVLPDQKEVGVEKPSIESDPNKERIENK